MLGEQSRSRHYAAQMEHSAEDLVSREIVGETGVVRIERAAVRNAVDGPTANALVQALRELDVDPRIKSLILTGSGGHFCAGADLKAIGSERGNRVELAGDGPMGPTRLVTDKPVIAAVEGYAVAGGLELAVWCDLRVAARDATFGVFCRRWGVPLIDGGTVRLPRLIGQSRALDLILTGRPVSAEEALGMGLVNRVCEPGQALSAALELCAQLNAFPQGCMRADRKSAYAAWDLGWVAALREETRGGMDVIRSGETGAGAARFAGGAGRHGTFDLTPKKSE